ncbi:MAG: tetratricopeptide repeat protein [Maricaulaceae bacterium]
MSQPSITKFALDALSAPVEAPLRDVTERDAVEQTHLPDLGRLDQARTATNAADQKRLKKVLALLRRATKALGDNDVPGAAQITLKALELDPEHAIANHVMGMALDKLGHLSRALVFYEKSWKSEPDNPELYHSIGMLAWKLDKLEIAEKFYRINLRMKPDDPSGIINLGGVLRDQAKFDDAIALLRQALYRWPENALLWNSLASTVVEQGDPQQSIVFFEEAIRLAPDFSRGMHNLALSLDLVGQLDRSTTLYEKAIALSDNPADTALMRFGRAHTLLASGRFEEGWDSYEARLDPDYKNAPFFTIKTEHWRGDMPVTGRRVLVVGEQGLGDEVLFMNTFGDFLDHVGPEGEVTLACEPRLVSLFQRSFPNLTVGRHSTVQREGRAVRGIGWIDDWSSFDYWAPMGSMVRFLRRGLSDFPNRVGYLTPDPDRVAAIKAQLDALGSGVKVGLAWRSMVMNAQRSKFFSPFERWGPVLKTPGAKFVSLQYGDTSEDLAFAKERFGATVHVLEDLDLKDDLEGVAALGAALDLFIGPMNASTNLGAACGGNVWFVGHASHWPFHSTARMPWYPQARVFSPRRFGDWTGVMRDIGGELAREARAYEAHAEDAA